MVDPRVNAHMLDSSLRGFSFFQESKRPLVFEVCTHEVCGSPLLNTRAFDVLFKKEKKLANGFILRGAQVAGMTERCPGCWLVYQLLLPPP